jgi:hypothetical protein
MLRRRGVPVRGAHMTPEEREDQRDLARWDSEGGAIPLACPGDSDSIGLIDESLIFRSPDEQLASWVKRIKNVPVGTAYVRAHKP